MGSIERERALVYMKKILTVLLLSGVVLLPLAAGTLQLSKSGRTHYSIVYSSGEKEAAEELKLHLDQITGAKFPIVKEGRSVKGPAIYLGNTALARKLGIHSAKLAPEEWIIRDSGQDLVIAGGFRQAVQMGVYDLLETQFGCRWLAWDTTVIPKYPSLTLKSVNIRKKPSFDLREIYDDLHFSWRLKDQKLKRKLFRKRIRASGAEGILRFKPRYTRRYSGSHNFYYFLNPKKYFKTHPEYFSMNRQGKRVHGTIGPSMQGANFCLTNPEVRKIVAAKMLETIALDRKDLPEGQWPDIYHLSPMDSDHDLCLCPPCAALEKKERKMGLLLNFINFIARTVREKYPDVTIQTLSYSTYVEPPVSIRPEKNVVIQWCNLYGYNDCYRPITHPVNAGQKAQFDRWAKNGSKLAVWAYWNMGGRFFTPARVETMVDAIAPELRYYHKNGVVTFFVEMEMNESDNMQNFYYLQAYVALKLLCDISQDEEKLISDFMKGYYGPAEKPMTAFLNRLRKAVAAEPSRMTSVNGVRTYCTEGFMRKCWNDLEQAYRLTKPGTIYRDHVEREMLSPMSVILRNTEWKIFSREKMIARYTAIRKRLIENYAEKPGAAVQRKKEMQKKLQSDLTGFIKVNIPVPEQFKDRKVKILGWPQLCWTQNRIFPDQYASDPDSVAGKVLVSPKPRKSGSGKGFSIHSRVKPGIGRMYSTAIGIYDYASRDSISRDLRKIIPNDEKYHWYKIGTYNIRQGSFVWIYYWRCLCPLGSVWQPDDGMPGLNVWEIWVSLKFTGPAYVKGSKQPDRIWWDQVLLVKPEKKKVKK